MKTALFINWTNEEFIGYWDGKGRRFPSGQSMLMPDYLAKHFAKHLTNKELLRTVKDEKGNIVREKAEDGRLVPKLVYQDGEKYTSPKFPEQVPLFMEFFNKAYQKDDSEALVESGDEVDTQIAVANSNRKNRPDARVSGEGVQVADFPSDGSDDDMEGSPKE